MPATAWAVAPLEGGWMEKKGEHLGAGTSLPTFDASFWPILNLPLWLARLEAEILPPCWDWSPVL